jgi:ubiquinol-cytochrome c reductase iron-sulfur subunit
VAETASTSPEPTRRDFLYLATGAAAGVAGIGAVWPFVAQLQPDASQLALASVEINISSIQRGQAVTVMWRGRPVFVRHRTEEEITAARGVQLAQLPDPQADDARHKANRSQWLVLVGVCTHLGCVPLGTSGDFKGWFCPCHGSHYDTSGRIRRGPAPKNLEIPPYEFVSDTSIRIG